MESLLDDVIGKPVKKGSRKRLKGNGCSITDQCYKGIEICETMDHV